VSFFISARAADCDLMPHEEAVICHQGEPGIMLLRFYIKLFNARDFAFVSPERIVHIVAGWYYSQNSLCLPRWMDVENIIAPLLQAGHKGVKSLLMPSLSCLRTRQAAQVEARTNLAPNGNAHNLCVG